ncbi:hypothetical protein [Pseudomonas yamanorum]
MSSSSKKTGRIEFSLLQYKAHVTQEDVRAALGRVLEDQRFARSDRLCTLLRFLVENALQETTKKLTEYDVGLSVFDRDPTQYATCDDPIVRVQIGRLRKKLTEYYSSVAPQPTLRFSVPLGSYIPSASIALAEEAPERIHRLSVRQFKCITHAGAVFTQGLCEELSYRLFESFDNPIISHSFTASRYIDSVEEVVREYTLEGSVRVEPSRLRTSVRLVDTSIGLISWSAQFDRDSNYGITIQEDLANTICCALKAYFDEHLQPAQQVV